MSKAGDHRDFAAILARRGFAAIQKIGEGSFGVAVLVEDADAIKAVCKMIDVSRASAKEVRDAKREGRLLARLKHEYIVRYMDSFADRGWLGILMEFADCGDLTAVIDTTRKARQVIPEESVVRWFSQAMLALQYLHSHHILHRDLKPSNLFLTKERDLRVGDFGVSKAMTCTGEMAHTLIGTPYYLSPEVAKEKPYAWPADIWAMGCILYQMCALRVPFDARNMVGLVQKITTMRAPEIPEYYSEPIRQICLRMMNRSASARPTANQVVETSLVQSLVRKLREEMTPESTETETKVSSKYEVMDRFRMFDVNGDGVIDRDEFGIVLKHLDAEIWTDERIDHMMRLADTNGDGKIQFDEFVHWIFGAGEGVGLASRAQQMIELAHKAAAHSDLDLLGKSLLRWRQSIDIGYLHVSPPEVATKTCESLAWLALGIGGLLESTADVSTGMNIAKQMSAILHHVDQLLVEYSQPAVRRLCAVGNRIAVQGLCLELADGTRLGECPNGLSDDALFTVGTRWHTLAEGEHILEVKGIGTVVPLPTPAPKAKAASGTRRSLAPSRGRSSSPAPEPTDGCLAAGLILCTNTGRELSYGRGLAGDGTRFSFKAAPGSEVVEVLFNGGTCVGVRTASRAVDWPPKQVNEVREAFRLAAESVCNSLLMFSWKVGPQQGKYAHLQARRLGVKRKNLYVPTDIKQSENRASLHMEVPRHWDVPARSGPGAESAPTEGAVLSELNGRELRALQELLTATHVRRCSRPAKAKVPDGMVVIRAARLQNPMAWANFVARRESIRGVLEEKKVSGDFSLEQPSDLLSDNHLKGFAVAPDGSASSFLGMERGSADADVNCCWLFHGLSFSAAEGVLHADFAIDRTGALDGRLYGHGVYFTECSSRADVLTLGDGDGDGVRCLLLCRCVLGNILTDEAMLPDVVNLVSQCLGGGYHSVMGDRRKRNPDSFRDFVVYDADQVYPEFLIWYRRVYQR